MKIYNKRYYGSTCHIVEFNPYDLRLVDTAGDPTRRQHIASIYGDPKINEVTWLRVNRSFYHMSNPRSLSIGDAMGDAFINAAFKDKKLYFEPDIPDNPKWNVGTSYLLMKDRQYSYANEQYFSAILGKNPRTFFGQGDNMIKFIAADGRRLFESGLSSNEQRAVCRAEGLHNAANLDGGGSSALMIEDRLINKSYDGRGLGHIFCGYKTLRRSDIANLPLIGGWWWGSYRNGVYTHLLQRLLWANGVDTGYIDGLIGNVTRGAIRAYQQRERLTVDGLVGQITWGRLLEGVV